MKATFKRTTLVSLGQSPHQEVFRSSVDGRIVRIQIEKHVSGIGTDPVGSVGN